MTTNNSMNGTVRRLAWACLAMAGVCAVAFSAWAEAEENDYGDLVRETLSVGTLPGTVLQHGHVYQVKDDVTVDATMQPGVSALRVPVASAVIIEIASGKTLTVKGGAGYGKIPGGAGIEVPYGAKLVIAGEGTR